MLFGNVKVQSHDEGDNIFSKLKLAKINWWWQFLCKDKWTPDSTSKLDFEVEAKYIQDDGLFITYGDSLVNLWWLIAPTFRIFDYFFSVVPEYGFMLRIPGTIA